MKTTIEWPPLVDATESGLPLSPESLLRVVERFRAKVERRGECWEWTAARRPFGYGAFGVQRKTWRAHRLSFALHTGDPSGACVLHACDNPACVRPDHLFLGTRADNNLDMVKKGRHVPGGTHRCGAYKRGPSHHAYRLTPETIGAIRAARGNGLSYSQICSRFGVSQGYAWRICNGKARQE